ncbi:MAG: DUF6265 family protein [Bacteroidota bacterium]
MKRYLTIASLSIATITLLSFLLIDSTEKENNHEYAWLAGHWVGDGFGGTSEEVWSKPAEDGTMMGIYRHHKGDGSLNFYEFIVLDETGMRLKHFTPELKAWEEKEEYVTFKMVEYNKDKIEMKGLVFERIGDDKMEIRLNLKDGDKTWTEVFNMRRQ